MCLLWIFVPSLSPRYLLLDGIGASFVSWHFWCSSYTSIFKKFKTWLSFVFILPDSCRAKPGSILSASGESQKNVAAPEVADLIAPGTPIQFDIMLPASEFQDQNRAGGRWVDNRKCLWVDVCESRNKKQEVHDAGFLKVGLIVAVLQFPGSWLLHNGSLHEFKYFSSLLLMCVGLLMFPAWQTHKPIWRDGRWLFIRKWR